MIAILHPSKQLRNNWEVSPVEGKEMLGLLLKYALAFAAAAYVFYDSIMISIVFASLPVIYLERIKNWSIRMKKQELTYQFKDALYAMAVSIAAGRMLGEALEDANKSMRRLYGEHGMIVRELTRLINSMQACNESEEVMLAGFSRRCKIPEIENFTDVYLTTRKTGGDISRIIMKTSDMIMDKIAIKRDIAVMTSQKRLEGRLLTIFPFLVTGMLKMTSPDYIQPLYDTWLGRIVMTVAFAGVGAASVMIGKINDIEV